MDKKSTLLLLLLVVSLCTAAQRFGGNPPSVKWNQLNTDTARIIFPSGLEQQAREVSAIVHKLSSLTSTTLGGTTRKVNIVMQTLPTTANGYVSMGPFRSEFFLTPRQNSFELGSLPWHKTLALHEYRHVQQYSNFRRGLSKAFYYVFGQEGQALANSLAVPDWFFEGDAVHQETQFSNQGRGRLPFFYNDYRSLWASGKDYSWMKLRNGSLRDLVPNHYPLGYMLADYGYKKYGIDVWRKVTNDAASFKSLIYPFQKAFRKNTGQSFISFRKEAMEQYKKESNLVPDSASSFGRINKHFAGNEQYPQWRNESEVIFVHDDYSHIPAFFAKNVVTGESRKIRTKSISTDDYFSYRNNRIVYSAFEPDARWGWKNYEVLKVIDVTTGEEKTITRNTRLLSPDISNDGSKIVAVNSAPSGQNNLAIIDASNGSIINNIPNPDKLIFTYPKFVNAKKVVAAVRNNKGEMALGNFDIESGEAQWIVPFTSKIIAFPNVEGDTISFSMSDGDRDKLFIAVNNKVYRFDPAIANHSTGNYQLASSGGKYVWTSFTAVGYKLFSGAGAFTEVSDIPSGTSSSAKEKETNLITAITTPAYTVTRYPASYKLFNFHSWRPYFSDPEYSYSLISQNILNTLQSEIYFTYNRNERFKETGATLSYAGFYPVLSAGGSFTFDRSFIDSGRVVNWNEANGTARVSVPLSFAAGSFIQNLNLAGSIHYQTSILHRRIKKYYSR